MPDGRTGITNCKPSSSLLDAGDVVHVGRRDDDKLLRQVDIQGVSERDDLSLRAASMLRGLARERGVSGALGADIRLQKALPISAGLGGGSSDAAAVLVALNAQWGLGLSRDELARLGARLGADVPVFVRSQSAWGEGIGDRLTAVGLGSPWYVVVTPPAMVSTASVFGNPSLTRNTPKLKIADFLRAVPPSTDSGSGPKSATGPPAIDLNKLWASTRNDCESVVRHTVPPVRQALDRLGGLADARMTGTGASVFARFDTEADARRAAAQAVGWGEILLARGVDRVESVGAGD